MAVNKQLDLMIENIAQEHDLSKEQLQDAIIEALTIAAQKSATRPVRDLTVDLNKGAIRIVGKFKVVEKLSRDANARSFEIAYDEIVEKMEAEKRAARFAVERERKIVGTDKAARREAELKKQELIAKRLQEIEDKYDMHIGDIINWEITPSDFGRVAANAAKQAIQKVIRKAERTNIMEKYQNVVGNLVQCTYVRTEREKNAKQNSDEPEKIIRNSYSIVVLVDGKHEGVIPSTGSIPNERFEVGDRFRALLDGMDVEGKYLFQLNRNSTAFLEKIMEEQVADLRSGEVEIKAVARAAGVRSKVVVTSNSKRIDPVGACLGRNSVTLKHIMEALKAGSMTNGNGERVDIIRYSENFEEFAKAVLKPAEIEKMTLDEQDRVLTIKVAPGNHSKAIGAAGRNVSLAGALLRCKIKVEEEKEIKDVLSDNADVDVNDTPQEEAQQITIETPVLSDDQLSPEIKQGIDEAKQLFMDTFGIDEQNALVLARSGHLTIEGVLKDQVFLSLNGVNQDAINKINEYFAANGQK